MPFHGRPSDACGPCRKGRLRVSSPLLCTLTSTSVLPVPYALQCDRIRPSCTQCIRKSIVCFGYRNIPDLLFKDESESTARKVRWGNGELYAPNILTQSHRHELLPITGSDAIDAIPSPACSLTPSYDEQAISYFMSSFVPSSPFYYLPDIYTTTPPTTRDALSSAILAASFASLSVHTGNGELMNHARLHYSRALTQTNSALASSNTAILDNSLMSVLILGLFEAIAFSGTRSSISWTAHTLGAVQLIRLRGTKQLNTDLGARLFLQTCNNIRSSCIQRGVPVPDELLQLYDQAKPFLDPALPNVRIGPLLDKLANLKARIEKNFHAQKVSAIINDSLLLDKEAKVLMDMLPDNGHYKAKPPHMIPQWVYQGLAHQYPEHRTARQWNVLRVTRLFLNEVVWHVAAYVHRVKEQGGAGISWDGTDFDTGALQATAAANRNQMITDILASVPHFLDDNTKIFGPAARFLIWPLTVLAGRPTTPDPVRRYVIWCLYEIASQARIPQSLYAAEAIEAGSSTEWYANSSYVSVCFIHCCYFQTHLTRICVVTI
jgi:Fungal specific transcription factor domain